MKRVAYTKRERSQITQHQFGHRPVNAWGDGDLPAPWAAGDIVEYQGGGEDGRLDEFTPGHYVVCTAFSIDEGDAWYFRISGHNKCSDRLHVVYKDRSEAEGWSTDGDLNYMAPMRLVDTSDPDGLATRSRMLAEGWTPSPELASRFVG